jgi:hypothetical protein
MNIAGTLPQSLLPAVAPALLAVGGGSDYAVLFGTGAVAAAVGALTILPVRRVR